MTDPAATAKALIQRKGAVRSRELVDAGVARVQLSRLVAAGELIRLARGVYTAPGAVLPGSEEGVLVVPGSSFNVPYRNHFRVTLLPEPGVMRDVFARIDRLLARRAEAVTKVVPLQSRRA